MEEETFNFGLPSSEDQKLAILLFLQLLAGKKIDKYLLNESP
jgi:hypothetical protein